MKIDEVCARCGAERPSWLGSAHRFHDWESRRFHVPVCKDGLSPDEAWRTFRSPGMSRPWSVS